MNGVGTGPIPWMLVGELIPSSIRLLGSCVVISVYYSMQFCAVTCIPFLVDAISLGPSLMLFGTIDVLGSLMVWAFIPETKKKLLKHIEKEAEEDCKQSVTSLNIEQIL